MKQPRKNPSGAKPKSIREDNGVLLRPSAFADTGGQNASHSRRVVKQKSVEIPSGCSAVRAHRRKVLNGKNLGEDIQLCGATTEKIVGSSPIDTRHIPSASLNKIFEKWERKMSYEFHEIIFYERDGKKEWSELKSEIREVLVIDRIAMKCAGDMINEKTKELALKSKRIAELEERIIISCNDCEAEGFRIKQDERIAALEKEKKEAEDLANKWRESDRKQIAEIVELKADIADELLDKLASMKKAKA